jgi:hypothetical protein
MKLADFGESSAGSTATDRLSWIGGTVKRGRVVDVDDIDLFKENPDIEGWYCDGDDGKRSDAASPRNRCISSRKFFLKKFSRVSWNGMNSWGHSCA